MLQVIKSSKTKPPPTFTHTHNEYTDAEMEKKKKSQKKGNRRGETTMANSVSTALCATETMMDLGWRKNQQ